MPRTKGSKNKPKNSRKPVKFFFQLEGFISAQDYARMFGKIHEMVFDGVHVTKINLDTMKMMMDFGDDLHKKKQEATQ